MSNRNRRIAKEIADIQSDTTSKITANLVGNGDDLTHLKGSFKGPGGTPYEGGTYVIDVRIPNDYPFKPPIMRFDTRIWHPNVSSQTVSFPSVRCRVSEADVGYRVLSALIHSRLPGHPFLQSSRLLYLYNRS